MLSKKKMAVINRSAERTQLMTVAVLALQGAFAEHEKIPHSSVQTALRYVRKKILTAASIAL